MESLSLIWIVVFCAAALLFFCTAAVIAVLGVQDLKDLLSHASKTDRKFTKDMKDHKI
jgi:hypothetical protein